MKTMMINNTNNNILRAEREKSKLSKLQTDYYLQQPKQHKPTTYCAQNNTLRAKGIYDQQ